MPGFKKTKYPGVKYRVKTNPAGKQERVYYISYRTPKPGGGWRQHTEVAGYQYRDAMTAAKANIIRGRRVQGKEKPNRQRRADARARKKKRNWTIAALWQEYQAANGRWKNFASDKTLFNRYLEPGFGDKKPSEILALDIDRLRRRQLKDKSPQTVAHALELLRRLVNFGKKRGLCQGPGFIIQVPKVHNEKTEDLAPAQLKKLLEVIDYHETYRTPYRWGAYMMRLVLLTGVRRSELLRLRWDDIDWHRGNILLRDAKSGRDETIPLSSHTRHLLERIREAEPSGSEYIIPGRAGGKRSDIRRQIGRVKAEAELPPDFRPLHGLRHVFASGLISRGVSLDVVARLLTHKSRSVTGRYAHIRDDALREAAQLAGELIEQAASDNVVGLTGKG